MSISIKLKKGFDIRLEGVAQKKLSGAAISDLYGIKPIDFPGLIPKLEVKPGVEVLTGTPLFHDKLRPEIKFTSPVKGRVISIERGGRRKILEVIVEKNGIGTIEFGKGDPENLSSRQIKERILISGLWPVIRQRPYNIIADPADEPKSVFISGFDTAPLAPDYNFIFENISHSLFQKGINTLARLTRGNVNLVLKGDDPGNRIFEGIEGIKKSFISGPHPAGNVGVQIHHLDPVNKGEVVWYINFQDVASIGTLFEEGVYKPEKVVALTGSEVVNRQYYKMLTGGAVTPLVDGNVKSGELRYISGNVLTGINIGPGGFLGFYDSQITVIPEGRYHEFFGWASPGLNKFSFSRTFLSSLIPKKTYRLDTNIHGGERAFVVTGQYEKVVPMDILPMQLFKAIIAEDVDMLENLGIYEVAEEDFALCEYICPSKIEIQSLVRKGLDLMRKEMS
jgi:Na+-transporting NADH:ubiquinone oxidoreductase subunit A